MLKNIYRNRINEIVMLMNVYRKLDEWENDYRIF